MLSGLDESLLHQSPLTFEHAATSDHRFFDRIVFGCFHPDGEAAFVMGMGVYKNMNVIDGFVMAQSHGRRQYNVRFSKSLRPLTLDMTTRLGPLGFTPVEPFKHVRVALREGDYPIALEVDFRNVLPARLEKPHTGRLDGRLHTDYLRYHQLGQAEGWVVIDGERFEIKQWFSWRDHSWGIRPFVGGFEPMTGTQTGSGLPSALRSGTKDIMVVLAAFWNGREGGNVQFIEDGAGKRLYTDGMLGVAGDAERADLEVSSIEPEIHFYPGTKIFERMNLTLGLHNGEQWRVEAQSIGRPWVYRGGGYDKGFFDGKGLGVWRSAELYIEQDVYDVSDVEAVVMSDGSVCRPSHREQFSRTIVNGLAGFSYSPCIVIGSHPRFGID